MFNEGRCVFVAGGTGYIGQKLMAKLLLRGHEVRALVRSGSEKKLPAGCRSVPGNALDGASYANQISPATYWLAAGQNRTCREDTAQ